MGELYFVSIEYKRSMETAPEALERAVVASKAKIVHRILINCSSLTVNKIAKIFQAHTGIHHVKYHGDRTVLGGSSPLQCAE